LFRRRRDATPTALTGEYVPVAEELDGYIPVQVLQESVDRLGRRNLVSTKFKRKGN